MKYYNEKFMPKKINMELSIPLVNKKRIDDIIPFLKNPVLDVGCYIGNEVRFFSNLNFKVSGVDVNENALIKARKKSPDLHFYQLNFENTPSKEKYNSIYLFDVIEHIFDYKNMLKNIVKSLNKNGNLIITTPNMLSLKNRLEILVGKSRPFNTFPHIRFFTPQTIRKELESQGLDVVFLKTYSKYPLPQGLGGSMTVVGKKRNPI